MYKNTKPNKVTLTENKSTTGESIENKMARILNNKEPIKDGAPRIYTDRKDGVQPAYNIRTDRFDVAIEAHDKLHKAKISKREAKVVEMPKETKNETKKDGGAESTQATEKII